MNKINRKQVELHKMWIWKQFARQGTQNS